jgi:CheY-like chemotaxis protein
MAAILLADDDTAMRDFVRRALEGDGHRVVAVADGVEALERISATAFDLLVSDVDMPGLDGITLATRATGASPRMAVLLMSGFSEELTRSKEVGAARLAVLTKPFTLDQLKTTVRSLLG